MKIEFEAMISTQGKNQKCIIIQKQFWDKIKKADLMNRKLKIIVEMTPLK
ncbi:MAG: hypothetical protein AABW88_01730 [Nanoarchaeota archaeon]